MRRRAGIAWALTALTALAIAVVTASAPSGAQTVDASRIISLTSAITVDETGAMRVDETIVYDHGPAPTRFVRTLPARVVSRSDPFDLEVEVVDVRVSRDGTDVTAIVTADPLEASITDTDVVVPTGVHTYALRYTVLGASSADTTGTFLEWDIVGTSWRVPVDAAAFSLSAPQLRDVRCIDGACTVDGDTVRGTRAPVPPFTGFVVQFRFGPTRVAPDPSVSDRAASRADRVRVQSVESDGTDSGLVTFAVPAIAIAGVLTLAVVAARRRRTSSPDAT